MQFVKSMFVAAVLAAIPAMAMADDAAPAAQPAAPPAGLVIAMGFPSTVHMNNNGQSSPARSEPVPVTFQLTNLTDKPAVLTAANECMSQTWKVTDSTGKVVDDQSICPQIEQPVSLTVTSAAPVDKQLTINMHTFSYNEGQTYTLTFNYFGLTQQAQFSVQFYLGPDPGAK